MKPRLAVVLSHPVQYYSPWFRELASAGHLDLRVFYLWNAGVTATRDRGFGESFRWDIPLLDGCASEFVPNVSSDPGTHHAAGLDNPTLVARLRAWNPSAILLFGYTYRSHMRVLLSRRLAHVPLLFRGDSHDMGREATLQSSVGRSIRRVLFRRFSAFLSVGQAHRAYLLHSGVPASRIHHVPHCVDNARFRAAAPEAVAARPAWRASHGIPASARVALFAGKLEPKKAPQLLLRAFLARTPQRSDDDRNVLLFVGSGELEGALRAQAGDRIGRDVFFVPFQNQSVMPTVYAAADLLVLPSASSGETWGLVVNEAMNLARPAIVSDRVGCGPDLVTPGETGWVFPSGDADALGAALRDALSDPARLARMGEAARNRMDAYSYEAASAALETVLDGLPTSTTRRSVVVAA
jgi:glycosyltransferase involved in cell wall biosynthesis